MAVERSHPDDPYRRRVWLVERDGTERPLPDLPDSNGTVYSAHTFVAWAPNSPDLYLSPRFRFTGARFEELACGECLTRNNTVVFASHRTAVIAAEINPPGVDPPPAEALYRVDLAIGELEQIADAGGYSCIAAAADTIVVRERYYHTNGGPDSDEPDSVSSSWRIFRGEQTERIDLETNGCAPLGSSGELIAFGLQDGTTSVQTLDGEQLHSLPRAGARRWSEDERFIVGLDLGTVWIFDRERDVFDELRRSNIVEIDVAPDGRHIVASLDVPPGAGWNGRDEQGSLYRYDGGWVHIVDVPCGGTGCVHWSSDGMQLAVRVDEDGGSGFAEVMLETGEFGAVQQGEALGLRP